MGLPSSTGQHQGAGRFRGCWELAVDFIHQARGLGHSTIVSGPLGLDGKLLDGPRVNLQALDAVFPVFARCQNHSSDTGCQKGQKRSQGLETILFAGP